MPIQRAEATVRRITLEPDGGRSCWLDCPPEARPAAGQATLVLPLAEPTALRRTCYPLSTQEDSLRLRIPNDDRWLAGDRLELLGPIGAGFRPPEGAKRWLLWAHQAPVGPLLPLIEIALARDLSVVVAGPAAQRGLPPEVEGIGQVGEALPWADYLAVCLPPAQVGGMLATLDPPGEQQALPSAEALLYADLPCGFGGCGACGLPLAGGWRLRCAAGPVFPLDLLRG